MDARFVLYELPTCPFCIRVRRAAQELNIPLELVDIRKDPQARERLIEANGRSTVPVLGIPTPDGERLMPESRDIIAFLRQQA